MYFSSSLSMHGQLSFLTYITKYRLGKKGGMEVVRQESMGGKSIGGIGIEAEKKKVGRREGGEGKTEKEKRRKWRWGEEKGEKREGKEGRR